MESLTIYQRPSLRRPYLVVGLGGWANAAEVSTGTVAYLKNKLGATKFAELDPERFYDFSFSRPLAVVEEGLVKELAFPANEFYYWRNEKSDHDLILLLGVEPNLRWGEFIDTLIGLAQEFGVSRLYSVGGLFDSLPHTREPLISSVANDPALSEALRRRDIGLTDYHGPVSLHTALLLACRKRDIEAVTLWGRAPHYVKAPNPKVCHGVLRILVEMLGIEIDLWDIAKAGEELVEQVNKALDQDPLIRTYVSKLEEAYEASAEEEGLDKEGIVRAIEEFLRRQQGKRE